MVVHGLRSSDTAVRERVDSPVVVGFELVAFRRRGGQVEVVVSGMSSSLDLVLAATAAGDDVSLAVMGTLAQGRLRPYRLTAMVDVTAGAVVITGAGQTERIVAAQLPENVPVVCGADPLLADLSGEFLHRRDGRLVAMRASTVGSV